MDIGVGRRRAANASVAYLYLGEYALHERIGAGGQADVWRASSFGADGVERQVVIKRARADTSLRHFVKEGELCGMLRHGNIVQTLDVGVENGEHFIVMEFVDGWSLLHVLRRACELRRFIPVPIAIHVVLEVCKALDYAHTLADAAGRPIRLVHMDVCPSNILVDRRGRVKLTDFGLARLGTSAAGSDAVERLCGKPAYVSPELVEGRTVDHRADLFAAGVVLYELCTLRRLCWAESAVETVSNVLTVDVEARVRQHASLRGPLSDVLLRSLARDRDRRYPSAAMMVNDLEQLVRHQGCAVSSGDVAELLGSLLGDGDGWDAHWRPAHAD